MDPVSQFFTQYKIPVGAWGKKFFSFLTVNFEWFFDSIARGLTFVGRAKAGPDTAGWRTLVLKRKR